MPGASIRVDAWAAHYPNHELDLGSGERLRFSTDGKGHIVGAIHDHPDRRGQGTNEITGIPGRCSGSIMFDVPEAYGYDDSHGQQSPHPKWHIAQTFPLTLTPSVLCRTCGDHGFVQQGRWVPA